MQGSFKDYFSLVVYLQISVNIRVGDVHALTGTLYVCNAFQVPVATCFTSVVLFAASFLSEFCQRSSVLPDPWDVLYFILFLTFFFLFCFKTKARLCPYSCVATSGV